MTIAPITSTIRGIPSELLLTRAEGMPNDCVANFDNLQTVPKAKIGDRVMRVSARKMRQAAQGIAFALGFEQP